MEEQRQRELEALELDVHMRKIQEEQANAQVKALQQQAEETNLQVQMK